MVGSQAYLIISLGIQVDAMLDLELFRFLEPPLDDARERADRKREWQSERQDRP